MKRSRNGRATHKRMCLSLQTESLEHRQLMAADLMGVVRDSNQWLLATNTDAYADVDRSYGLPGDHYLAGKWTGSSDFPGVARRMSDGLMHFLLDTDGDATHELDVAFGFASDRPVTGDWNGDGRDTVGAVRQGADGLLQWYFDENNDPNPERTMKFGLNSDLPVVGDWNADGRDDVGVVRPGADGLLHWYLDLNGDIWADRDVAYGLAGDTPVVGDWDGDGKDNFGAVRSGADGLRHWYLDLDEDIWAEQERVYGFPTDAIVVGDWQFGEVEVAGVPSYQNDRAPIVLGSKPSSQAGELVASFSLRNTGNQPLSINHVTVTGNFVLDRVPTGVIAPGTSDAVVVRLNASVPGVHDGVLSIGNSDSNESPYLIRVRAYVTQDSPGGGGGTVVQYPEVNVVGIRDGQTASVEFGSVKSGSTATRSFTIENLGGKELTLSNLSLPAGFFVVRGLPSLISPRSSAEMVIGMNTSRTAAYSGTLSFNTNDSDESIYNFPIRGTVVATPISGPEANIVGIADDQASAISFGAVKQGASVSKSFRVENLGTANLSLGTLTVPSGFTVATRPPATLAPGGSAEFVIRMDTAGAGNRSGRVSLVTNDTDENPYNFNVTGTVVARTPEVALYVNGSIVAGTSTSVRVGTDYLGTAGDRVTMTIVNSGDGDLTISNWAVPAGFEVVSGLPRTGTSLSVAAGRSLTVVLKLDTSSIGVKAGIFRFGTNDQDERSFAVSLRGKVYAPVIDVGGKAATTSNGAYTITATAGTRIEIDLPNGRMPTNGRFVITYGGSRITVDGSLNRVVIKGTRNVSIDNWTNLPVVFA